ncbi:MAG: type restriction enzyme subunit [Chthoniobacter sp.]|jgi:type I restriction enzyme S subunit|nr:type restriction enzyme subunit [Chthoniobacter sp.]
MAGKWEDLTLADLGRVVTGKTPLTAVEGNFGGRIPFVTPSDMDGRKTINITARYLTEIGAASVKGSKIPAGSVMVSCIGSDMGKAVIAGRDCVTNQQINSIVVDDRFSSEFVYYNLSTRKDEIRHQAASGSALPILNKGDFSRLEITLPPLAEQKAIAAVLGALDDKIALNRRMNLTLEAMARALFQSWFVDFDPVRAKLDGRQSSALDPATAALFPANFQDSTIGPVPKGWKVERFDAHITADRGLSYNGDGLRDDGTGLPMHNLNSVYEGGGYKHEGLKYYAGEYREKHLLEPGDMIVTNTEQGFDHLLIGHAAIVPRCYGPKGLFSHHIYRVRHKPTSPFSPHYLVELFNNRRWHYWISGFSNGTTINMLPKDALEMPMLVVPPVELVKKFNALAEGGHLQIEDNKQQSRTLATLRDTLLPKLLSGDLSIAT